MDCSIALALMLKGGAPSDLVAPSCPAAIVRVAAPPARANPLAHEPFYAGLVRTAGVLRGQTEAFGRTPQLSLRATPAFSAYLSRLQALSAGDLKGHFDLKARGTDRDLKCILLGISRDITNKIGDLKAAHNDAELAQALTNTDLLLSDNIDVIVTPDTVDSGLDCTLEFGKDA